MNLIASTKVGFAIYKQIEETVFKLWYFDSYQFHKFRKPQKITSLNFTLTKPSR